MCMCNTVRFAVLLLYVYFACASALWVLAINQTDQYNEYVSCCVPLSHVDTAVMDELLCYDDLFEFLVRYLPG